MKKQILFILLFFCYDFAFSQCSIVIPSLHTTSNSTGGSQQGQSFNTGSATGLLTTIRTNAIGGVSGTQLTNGIANSTLRIREWVNDNETGSNHALTGTILATSTGTPTILNYTYGANYPTTEFTFDGTLELDTNTQYVIEFIIGSGVAGYVKIPGPYAGGQAYDINGSNLSLARDFPFEVYLSGFSMSTTSTNISCFGLLDGSATATISGGSSGVTSGSYCASGPTQSSYSNIELVRLIGNNDSISNNTVGTCDTYQDYTAMSTGLTAGQTYNMQINLSSCPTFAGQLFYFQDAAKVFVDWNMDDDFDDTGEEVHLVGPTLSPSVNNFTITVPTSAVTGNTRMRIVVQNYSYNGNSTAFTACDNAVWFGSTEDYTLSIDAGISASYLWSTGDTTAQISNLSIGTYVVTVSANNCSLTDSVTITSPSAITYSATITNVSCNGGNDGTATLTMSGGTGTLTVDWGTANPNTLSAGTYPFTITDANNCSFSDSITITEPTTISVTSTTTNVSCNGGNDGTATLALSGGTGTLTADWGIANPNALSVGSYSYTITDSLNCTYTSNVSITGPTAISAISNITNVSCAGGNDGTATLTLSGGTGTLTVDWGTVNPNNLSVGTYSFTVTDSNSCTYTNSVTITQPQIISAIANVTNVSCNGGNNGSATLTMSGGIQPLTVDWGTVNPNALSIGTYSFTITDGNNCTFTDSISITQPSAIVVSTTTTHVSCNGGNNGTATLTLSGGTGTLIANWGTSIPNALTAGTHIFSITDSNNCSLTDSISISEPTLLSASYLIENVSCHGSSDGSAMATVLGGILPYNYIWSSGGTTSMEDSLSAGAYILTVTDSNNCSIDDTVFITQPAVLNASFSQINVSACGLANGSIDATFSGGTQPYTFTWSNGDTTEDISNLGAGQYTLIVTDSNNCSIFDTLIITQPSNNLLVSVATSNYNNYQISCNGGVDSVTTIVSGGSPGYSYLWSDGQTTPTASNLVAGNYTITVTDSNSCDYTISITLNEPPLLSNNVVSTNVLCNGSSDGSISVNVSGGVPNYNINWGGINNPNALSVGNYIITTTDSNACVAIDSVEITQPNLLSGSIMVTSNYNGEDVSCYGSSNGSVMATVLGGILPYNYIWSSGGTTSMEDSLSAGTYSLTVTDSNNCITTLNSTLTEPTALQIAVASTNVSCNGGCDGSLNATISGGTPGYSYNWSNNDNSPIADSLCAGIYNVVIIDVNGCMILDTANISEPSILTIISDSIIDVNYFGTNTGFIYASVSGGNSNYIYSWAGSNGFTAITEDLDSLYVGTYILTVSDSLGCFAFMQFIVDGPVGYPLIVQSDSIINVSCNGLCDGEIFITAEGGDSTYFYSWTSSNGFSSNQKDISGLCSGIYDLQLSDSSGNIFNISYQISEPNPLTISITTDSALCYGGMGLATVYPLGGAPDYTYWWSSGNNSQSASLLAGDYFILVTDSNNCSISDSLTILQADSMQISNNSIDATCFGLNNGSITVNILSGGQSPFTYSDDNGMTFQTTNTFFNLAVGTYSMVIMDNNNCISSEQITISQPLELTFTITATDATCYGYCDGTATLNISGGTPFYTENWGGLNQMLLCEGLVNVIVTDSNGCLATSFVTINEPAPLIVNISQNGNILDAGPGFSSYQWLDDNLNPISGATSQQFTPTTTGEYSVMVTSDNGCSANSFPIMFIADGISEINTLLQIYPNPTKDILNVHYQGFNLNSILIFDMRGNIVLQKNDIRSNKSNLELSLNQLPKGMYVLQLISQEKIINHSVILQ